MDDIIKTIEEKGDSIAVVLLPGVQYLTGQVFDMQRITQVAHSKGCMVSSLFYTSVIVTWFDFMLVFLSLEFL